MSPSGALSKSNRQGNNQMGKVGIAVRALGYLLLLPLVLTSWLGLLRTGSIPQYFAQLILEWLGPPLLLILLIGLALTLRRWLKTRRPGFLIPVVLIGSAVLASGYTLVGYVAAAGAHGVSINLARAVAPRWFRQGAPPHTFVYDRYDGEDAKLYVYPPSGERAGGAPILVYVHGGGWKTGDVSGRDRDLRWFAERGYLVVGVEYALSSDRRHLWDVTQPQIACSLAWVGKNAQRFGGDARRLTMFGESAGGNLVLNVGNLVNAGKLASRCGGQVPPIKAVVAISPPVDLAAIYNNPVATWAALAYLGGSPEQYPARYARVSPTSSTAPSNPPALIITGLDDNTVPVRDVLAYVKAAHAEGRPVDLITIPRAGHGFELVPGSIGNQTYRQATLNFFKQHGMQP